MFVDEAQITVKGGHGGAGRVSFYPPPMKGPDGGNGGRGGNIYVIGTSDLTALRPFTTKRFIEAEKGGMGGTFRKFGKDGKDTKIQMPVGTTLKNIETGEEIEITSPNEEILLVKGGLGGRGNYEFRSSRNTTPEYAQPGLEGDEKKFQVTLKLIADFGLIGLPNAGKSSLLNELTRASAKVANYPFTTLEPSLGVVQLYENNTLSTKILADVPGLIEGASAGKGLGTKFLKHIEKVGVLLHCISPENEDLEKSYKVIRQELEKHEPSLIHKKEIILLTKSDLISEKETKEKLKILKKLNKNSYPISIHDWDSLENLKANLVN